MSNHLHHGLGFLLTLLAVGLGLALLGLLVLSTSGRLVAGSGYSALTLSILVLGIALGSGMGSAWLHWRCARETRARPTEDL